MAGVTQNLANGSRIAYRYIKENLDDAIDREAGRMLRSQSTFDHKVAARAFVEKRSPNFEGR
ncbi:MAG: hypothetical protein AAF493_18320 [Pseudomonadota bacterium]